MNLKEYGKWSPYNKDNPKYDPDEYNRSFIKERYEPPTQQESSDYDEYYQPPGMTEAFNFERKQSTKSEKKNKDTRRLRTNMIRQVVTLAAGSVVITSSYTAVMQQKQALQQAVPSYTQTQETVEMQPNWKWSDDKQTVILELRDADGNIIKDITATVSFSDVEATCNKEGERTYTATAEDEGKQYSDTQTETLPPLGHAFDDGKEVVLSNNQQALTFECTRCHEQFTIQTSIKEND